MLLNGLLWQTLSHLLHFAFEKRKKNKQNDFAVNEYRITRAYQNVLFMHILWHIHTLASHFEIFSFITEQTTINSNHKAARLKLTTTDSEKKSEEEKTHCFIMHTTYLLGYFPINLIFMWNLKKKREKLMFNINLNEVLSALTHLTDVIIHCDQLISLLLFRRRWELLDYKQQNVFRLPCHWPRRINGIIIAAL